MMCLDDVQSRQQVQQPRKIRLFLKQYSDDLEVGGFQGGNTSPAWLYGGSSQ